MLKSYKQLDRWYGALEPEGDPSTGQRASEACTPLPDDDGARRYPDYILPDDDTGTDDPAPAELAGHRSEFTGGWSDWVVDHAPGPDDDYTPREGELVRFPWPDDEPLSPPARIGRGPARLRDAARETGATRRRTVAVLVVAVLMLGAAAAGVLYLLGSFSSDTHTADISDGAGLRFTAQSTDSAAVAQRCPTEHHGDVVRGAGPGGTDSGPAAIMRFQYAYYVERSGQKAREVVAPGSQVSPASVIQRGIDSVAEGTEHCVRIVTVDADRYTVEVTEYRPGDAPDTYSKQTVTTAVIDGRTLITGITAG